MKCPLTRRSIEFLNRFLKTKWKSLILTIYSDYYLILSSGILQSLELITLSDGEMVRLLFCQKLLLKDYFVKEII